MGDFKLHSAYRTKLPNILDSSTMSRQEILATDDFSEPVAMSHSQSHAQSGKMITHQSHGVTIQASGTDSKLMNLIDEELYAHNRARRLGKRR